MVSVIDVTVERTAEAYSRTTGSASTMDQSPEAAEPEQKRERLRTWERAFVGFLAGALVGLVVGASIGATHEAPICGTGHEPLISLCGMATGGGMMLGALVGGLTGLVIGATMPARGPKSWRWLVASAGVVLALGILAWIIAR